MWLLFAAVLSVVAYQIGKTKDKGLPPLRLKAGEEVVVRQEPSPLQILDYVLGTGEAPSIALLRMAYAQAVASGDLSLVQMVKAVSRSALGVDAPQEQVGIGQEVASESAWSDNPPDDADGDPESWGELANPAQAPTLTPSQPVVPTVRCPLDGVDLAAWSSFCEALRTRKPAWGSESHLGAWEHRRTRLRQLGIDDNSLTTEAAQYEALCRDIADYRQGCDSLIQQFAGKTVDTNGVTHSVTPSGVLGLLKAAGPKGAEGWLKNPDDRTKFPRTTEVFLRCNGNF